MPAAAQRPPLPPQTRPDQTRSAQLRNVNPRSRPRPQRVPQAMMQVLEAGDEVLWNDLVGWDVLVKCGPFVWCLHRRILQTVPYFAARVGSVPGAPPDAAEPVCLLALHLHDPGQLANVLRFLYFGDYPHAAFVPDNPWLADPVVTHAAMFVAGASVACQPMMALAAGRIAQHAAVLRGGEGGYEDEGDEDDKDGRDKGGGVPCPSDYAAVQLARPLQTALAIVWEQSEHDDRDEASEARRSLLEPLRMALTQLAEAALPGLAGSPAFRAQFRTEWEGRPFVDELATDLASLSVDGNTSPACAILTGLQQLAAAERTWLTGVAAAAAAAAAATQAPALSSTAAEETVQRLTRELYSRLGLCPDPSDDDSSGSHEMALL